MLMARPLIRTSKSNFSKYVHKDRSSKVLRQKFLDFFINEQNHDFVRSSPVVPFCDSTVAFVNAGMNQFKGYFLGKQEPHFKRVANSQKCVRIGGKHNDLSVVGTDGYHHTFFEMLGNWSFGDYFKKEALEMAWKLLTEVYRLPPSRLYVTYFKGDPTLGIDEDVETKEIWQTIGVPPDRILPFGLKDNFWEMGLTGPCGPCTEIHVDHIGAASRASFVNKGLHDLTELWNIVFIQYHRNLDGTIELLPQKHVDTGMGFERLTSIMQEKISNYDTDNFSYLIKAINKTCRNIPEYRGKWGENDWNNLDTSYRILADHSRMITACLADGVIPEEKYKLRRLMRKVFHLSETTFRRDHGLLKELSNYVIENLGPTYPEMEKNYKQIHQIIDYEEDIYKTFRKSALSEWEKYTKENPKLKSLDIIESPNIVAAYRDIRQSYPKSINANIAFRLYDSFGLDQETIGQLADTLGLEFDKEGLKKQLEAVKLRSREQNILNNNLIFEKLCESKIPKTDCSSKYDYDKTDKYNFKNLDAKILTIVENLQLVPKIGPDVYCSLILDKSNLYTEAGGQISDHGTIVFPSKDGQPELSFQITEAQNCDGYILHKGFLRSDRNFKIKVDDVGSLKIDSDFRLRNMRNHTATHLLNAIVKELKGATCQKSSKVTDYYLNLDLAIFSEKLSLADVDKIESRITSLIEENVPVKISQIDSQALLNLDNLTIIPGEIYPDTGIRIVEIVDQQGFVSREPCCGTHVFNTGDLQDFAIIGLKSLGRSTHSIYAVTGERAKIAKANGVEVWENIQKFEKNIRDNVDKPEILNTAVATLKQQLNFNIEDSSILPILVKTQCVESLNKISKQIKDYSKGVLREFVEIEMKNVLGSNVLKTKTNQQYMVHYLRSSMILETVSLQKATKMCPNIPVIVISYSDNVVKARCCVPKRLQKGDFDAEKWLQETVAQVFQSKVVLGRTQDDVLVCNMKPKKINIQDWDPLLNESVELAKKYIEEHL